MPEPCPLETFIHLEWRESAQGTSDAWTWVAICNGNLSQDCGFRFIFTDEDGDTYPPNEPFAITSGEMSAWVTHHTNWSALSEGARGRYETDHSLIAPSN